MQYKENEGLVKALDRIKTNLDPTDTDLFMLNISEDHSSISLLSGAPRSPRAQRANAPARNADGEVQPMPPCTRPWPSAEAEVVKASRPSAGAVQPPPSLATLDVPSLPEWTESVHEAFQEAKRQLRMLMTTMEPTRPWRHTGLIEVLRMEMLVRACAVSPLELAGRAVR